ncbi:MAG: UDP-3-O-(3-hydroxymyristoyl)glucosamine N-acyltransferase [Desulfobulbaceae bacterium]|nr:UDP-3-O-(3-hydroxymyristoyl)glucosamine N-acyltransferase [Desulfobulbaceae bacterium]
MANSFTLQELASLVGGEVRGDKNLSIRGLNGIKYASDEEITFITGAKKSEELSGCRAAAVIIPLDCEALDLPCIRVENPDLAAAVIHNHFLKKTFASAGIHPSVCMGNDCHIPEEVTIGPFVSIGDRVRIGERVTLYPGVVIGSDCILGDETILHANVSIGDRTIIGKRVIIYTGAAIGSDGFGYTKDREGRYIKKPQVGNVRIDDDVEIGANSCVDRAAFGSTRIRRGTKIDNLVMIGHNVDVGENAILVAQAGIAGSTTIGNNVILGAKAGIAGHLHIGDGVMVAAKGGVHCNLHEGAVVGGYPAIDIVKWRKAVAAYNRLPEMIKELKMLRKQVNRLDVRSQYTDEGPDQKREEE